MVREVNHTSYLLSNPTYHCSLTIPFNL